MAKRFLILITLLLATTAHATEVGIIATVNNDIVTSHELAQRIELIMGANGMPRTDEVRHEIAGEVLRGLIDDKLRLEAADANSIKVKDEDIRKAMASVAGQNNMSVEQFTNMLAAQGVEKDTLEDQLRAEIDWHKYVEQKILPNVDVPSSEIDRLEAQLKDSANRTSYLVAEIFLPVDSPADDEKAKTFGDNLIRQMAAGAKFSALAHGFSASASASRNGDLGWQTFEQMPPEIARIIKVMHPGQVSKPMRTLRGYYILYLRDTRILTADTIPTRDQLREAASDQQLDLLQRRELRDLRNKAFIEVK